MSKYKGCHSDYRGVHKNFSCSSISPDLLDSMADKEKIRIENKNKELQKSIDREVDIEKKELINSLNNYLDIRNNNNIIKKLIFSLHQKGLDVVSLVNENFNNALYPEIYKLIDYYIKQINNKI